MKIPSSNIHKNFQSVCLTCLLFTFFLFTGTLQRHH